MDKAILEISGMHCASCAKIIQMAVSEKEGVSLVSVNFDSKKAFLEFDPSKISVSGIKDAINKAGYNVIE